MTTPVQHKYLFAVLTCILLSFILVSCSSNGANFQGELFIKVLDAPASFQQMNIVVDRVSIHRTGTTADIGWTVATTNSSGSFDLLNLRNGRNLQLALNKVPVGTYDQIKINFGPCTIIQNGPEQLLNVDPTIQSGNSIAYGFQIIEGQQLQLTFDFDASRSVYKNGELYFFKPIIRVQNTVLSGSILGSVVRPDTLPNVSSVRTYTGVDSVSTLTDPNGSFQISDIPENTYTVTIQSGDPKLNDTTIANVIVIRKQATNIGAITLRTK
ncbi:MAG: DUF4382 domain-containing protein [Ignavibacteriales bacterium]|nr:DUF4382 domain-containing protein [Ignavibacteriales bacterium]